MSDEAKKPKIELKMKTYWDILTMPDKPLKDGQTWGIWTLDKKVLVLRDRRGYEVDLEQCGTPAGMLDWIMQVSSKAKTYSTQDIGDLVRALEEILEPQATICSFRQPKTMNVKEWMKRKMKKSSK